MPAEVVQEERQHVAADEFLDRPMIERGKPKMVVSDNGGELTSNAILA
jgi:transposase-like protein